MMTLNSKTSLSVLGLILTTAGMAGCPGCEDDPSIVPIESRGCREPGDDRPCFDLPADGGSGNPDGGGTTDDDPPPPPPANNGDRGPLSATLRLEVASNFSIGTQAFAKFFAPKAPADEDRILRERQEWDNESGYPTIQVGTCAVAPYLGPPPAQPLPNSAPGATLIKRGDGTTAFPLGDAGSGTYTAISEEAPFGTKLSLSLAGGPDIAAAELADFVNVPPRVVVTMPVEGPAFLTPNQPYTVAWTPLVATFFFVRLRASGHICKVDPMAGTFTIPGDVIAAQGLESPGAELTAMNIGSAPLTVGGARRSIDVRASTTFRLPFRVQF